MQLQPFIELGNIEIANELRTLTYIRRGLGDPQHSIPLALPVTAEEGLPDILDDVLSADLFDPSNLACYCSAYRDAVYVSPRADQAPWYRRDRPESAEFLGVIPRARLAPVTARAVTPRASFGASLGPQRRGHRRVEVRGLMYASSKRGMAYGERWLIDVLEGRIRALGPCRTNDLRVFTFCSSADVAPVEDEDFIAVDAAGTNDGTMLGTASAPVLEDWYPGAITSEPAGGFRTFGTALRFDGAEGPSAGGVSCGERTHIVGPFTLEARIEPEFNGGTTETIAACWDASAAASQQFWFRMTSTGALELIRRNAAGTSSTLTSAGGLLLVANNYRVAADWDGVTLRLYIDGVVVASVAATDWQAHDGVTPFTIGRIIGGGITNLPWQGLIDEVRFSGVARYGGAYSLEQQTLFMADSDTVALWHFDLADYDGERMLTEVGLVDGPVFGGPEDDLACVTQLVTFQLVSGSPYLLAAERELLVEQPFVTFEPDDTAYLIQLQGDHGGGALKFRVRTNGDGTDALRVVLSVTAGGAPNLGCDYPGAFTTEVAVDFDPLPGSHELIYDASRRLLTLRNETTDVFLNPYDYISLITGDSFPWVEVEEGESKCVLFYCEGPVISGERTLTVWQVDQAV